MNLRRKYINRAFTQPGWGFLNRGSESALLPPTSFLIQLVSICPGSQPAASRGGGQAAATPLPTACFLTGYRKVAVTYWCLPGKGYHPFPRLRGTRGAENSYHLQPLLFDSLLQPKHGFRHVPAAPLPTLGQGHASSTHLLEASLHFKGIPRRGFAGAPLPSNRAGNNSAGEIGPILFNVALWPFLKCAQPTRLAGLNFIAKRFERSMCF